MDLLKAAMDHSSERVTTLHYYNPINKFIMALPSAPIGDPPRERQKLLF